MMQQFVLIFVVGALNTTDRNKNVEKVMGDRHSILKQIARSKLEGFNRGDCNTSSFIVITNKQYGEHKSMGRSVTVSTSFKDS